ncbi:hypothetical protein K2173_016521 [Erythroxylum novogranatense]|uniref:Uncharacterized protein n=1 Tax=Erythroxylum novogranatense TaxID=1862640 RepID=A0AAV8SH47_9ROSI|nr:hypothetical protein K2173_016521 [Erythroxylum novogranatense]
MYAWRNNGATDDGFSCKAMDGFVFVGSWLGKAKRFHSLKADWVFIHNPCRTLFVGRQFGLGLIGYVQQQHLQQSGIM